MYYWLFMLAAIIFEVIAVLTMKHFAENSPAVGMGAMYMLLFFSYGSLSIAIKRIPLAVAYGIWESIGLILITLCSVLLFEEPLNFIQITGIAIIIAGALLLKHGGYRLKIREKN